MGAVNLEVVRYDDFAREEGTTFQVRDRATVLRLVEVSPATVTGGWESFSLVFCGPTDVPLDQRIHALDHEVLGQLELFLVPLGPDAGELRYESVFNRTPVDPGGA